MVEEQGRKDVKPLRVLSLGAGLHSSMKSLDEVDLRSDQEKGIYSLFDEGFAQECEGMCGI